MDPKSVLTCENVLKVVTMQNCGCPVLHDWVALWWSTGTRGGAGPRASVAASRTIIHAKRLRGWGRYVTDSPAQGQRLTEELLARLLASKSLPDYLDENDPQDRALPDYLRELLHAHGLKNRAEVARRSGINGTVIYDIFCGKSKPGRDHAIMLAFGLRCNLRETQRLLRMAEVSELWVKIRRDAIIIWCIENGFDRVETDDELYRLGEPTLLGTGGLR